MKIKLLFILYGIYCVPYFTLCAQKMAITIYQDNIAVIQEEKTFLLTPNESTLSINQLPETLIPTSVRLQVPIEIQEQRYEIVKLTLEELLKKQLKKRVILTREKESIEGILMSVTPTLLILQKEKDLLYIPQYQNYHFRLENAPLPNLTPSLSWKIKNGSIKSLKGTLHYQMQQLSWEAFYTIFLPLSSTTTQLELNGVASINNRTQTSFNNAHLQLITGTPYLISTSMPTADAPTFRRQEMMAKSTAGDSEPSTQKAFEYYRHLFPNNTSIPANSTIQLPLLNKKFLIYRKSYHLETSLYQNGESPITSRIEITNSTSTIWPRGTVRVYQQLPKSAPLLIGENFIDSTPLKEKREIEVGQAFDLKAKEYEMETKQINDKLFEKKYQITLKSSKDSDATVIVTKDLEGNITLKSANIPHKLLPGNRVQFHIVVPAKKEAILLYTLRFQHD